MVESKSQEASHCCFQQGNRHPTLQQYPISAKITDGKFFCQHHRGGEGGVEATVSDAVLCSGITGKDQPCEWSTDKVAKLDADGKYGRR